MLDDFTLSNMANQLTDVSGGGRGGAWGVVVGVWGAAGGMAAPASPAPVGAWRARHWRVAACTPRLPTTPPPLLPPSTSLPGPGCRGHLLRRGVLLLCRVSARMRVGARARVCVGGCAGACASVVCWLVSFCCCCPPPTPPPPTHPPLLLGRAGTTPPSASRAATMRSGCWLPSLTTLTLQSQRRPKRYTTAPHPPIAAACTAPPPHAHLNARTPGF